MYQEKCLSTKLIKQSDWSMVSSNEHMNHGRVRPELDRTKISKQAYSHCNNSRKLCTTLQYRPLNTTIKSKVTHLFYCTLKYSLEKIGCYHHFQILQSA